MNLEFYNQLITVIEEERVLTEEPMKKHTTFRVGGNADYFVMPKNAKEVKEIVRICQNAGMPYYVLGNGSNLLVGDKGYRGVMLQIYTDL